MDTTKQLYTNASIVIGGAVCAVMMANHFINQMSYYGQPSVVPGFRIMSYLCYPLLYYWAGMLLRAWKKDPEWWKPPPASPYPSPQGRERGRTIKCQMI